MADQEIKEGTTVKLARVDGELRAGRNTTIKPESGRKVTVTGAASFEGPVTIDCDFECHSMRVEGRGYGPGGNVTIRGSLTVHGKADIDASTRVEGELESEDLDIGGHLESGALTSKRTRIGGHLSVNGYLKSESADVGGHMKVRGGVDLVDLRVGGHAEFEGGTISGEIRVRGHIRSTKKLSFGQAQIFGNLTLPAGSSGRQLSALGTVRFEGDAACKELNVSGTTHVRGNLDAEHIEVKGRLDVSGALHVSQGFRVYGTAKAVQNMECETLGVLGKLTAERVLVTGHADVAGEVDTRSGLKAKSVLMGRGSRIKGPLVGDDIEIGREMDFGSMWGLPWWRAAIGRMTTLEDVYGKTIIIGQYSSVKRVFGDVVEMREGSIAYQVTYTKELKLPSNYYIHDSPAKVERLPEPPL